MSDTVFNLPTLEPKHPDDVDEHYHVINDWNVSEALYWNSLLSLVNDVPGCFVECGVGRGRSLLIVSLLMQLMGMDRHVYGFDSFEGFPDPSAEDKNDRNPQKGEWAFSPSGKYKYEPDFIYAVLQQGGVVNTREKVSLTKGFFSDTLPLFEQQPIAVLHVDCDLYQSHLDVLENLYDLVVPGGVITFDDFILNKDGPDLWPGARQATEEFLADKGQTLLESRVGSPYLIKR